MVVFSVYDSLHLLFSSYYMAPPVSAKPLGNLDDGRDDPLTLLIAHFPSDSARYGRPHPYAIAFDAMGRSCMVFANLVEEDWTKFDPKGHVFVRSPGFDDEHVNWSVFNDRRPDQLVRGEPFHGAAGRGGVFVGPVRMARPQVLRAH